MKRKLKLMGTALLLTSSIFFSSCIGSFTLFNKLLTWNKTIDNQWVNELIFLVLSPAYGVAYFTDIVVLNSIEFWTGENPALQSAVTKEVETENGHFVITTDSKGHTVREVASGEVVEFRFNKSAKSWDLVVDNQVHPLLQFTGENQACVYLADGSTINVTLDQAGMMAFRQAIGMKAYFAVK